MKLLVTGGAGFIGSAFIRQVIAEDRDAKVVCFDKLTYAGNLDNLAAVSDDPRYHFVHGDICDREAVEDASIGVDAIVNFAAETHVDRSLLQPDAFIRTDVLGTHVLLEVMRDRKIARMVHVSTDEVYGSTLDGSFAEDHPLRPSSPYSASKAGGDLQVLAAFASYGLPVSITRGSNTYGPYQYPEKLIPLFVTNGLEGEKLPLYGDGQNVRDWLHVEDHARGIRFVLEHGEPGEVYNLGGGNERTNAEIARIICDELALAPDAIRQVADRPGHDRRYALDTTKLRELGFEASEEFERGLRDTIRWYRDNRWWWEAIRYGARDFDEWRALNYAGRS
jgi:dTDP-glucose 4,6-dehydratase